MGGGGSSPTRDYTYQDVLHQPSTRDAGLAGSLDSVESESQRDGVWMLYDSSRACDEAKHLI